MNKAYISQMVWIFYLIIGSITISYSQDIHYSQFYNSPLNLNPANTGLFKGDQRFMLSYRDQWRFVPVPWLTFSAAYDQKIFPKNSDKYFFGVGGNFNYDKQGSSNLNLASLNLSGSYTRILSAHHIITAGLLVGLDSRAFNPDNLTWDKQWDGVAYDPNLPSQENFDLKRLFFIETGAGINYRLQQDSRTKLDIGIGAYHLVEPKTNFYDIENQKLPRHYTLSAVGTIKVAGPIDIQLHGLRQIQGEYGETVFGGLAKIYLSQARGKETELHIGMGYRTAGSYIPTLALEYKNWYVGINYDIDKTEFNQILSNKGGPEVHVRYIIQKVRPMNIRKNCPIY